MPQTGTGKVLATFNIDAKAWEAFKTKAKKRGLSAAAALTNYVNAYIESASDPLERSSPPSSTDKAGLSKDLDLRFQQYLKKDETDFLDNYLESYLANNLEGYLQSYLSRYLARYLEELRGIQPEAPVTAVLSLGGELKRQALAPAGEERDSDRNLIEGPPIPSQPFSVGDRVKMAELIEAEIVDRRQAAKAKKGQQVMGKEGSVWQCEGEAIGVRGRPKLFRRIE